MFRLIYAGKSGGRWLRRPVVWLPLLAWVAMTPLVHRLKPLDPGALWRFWRRRKRATIAPLAPPMNPS